MRPRRRDRHRQPLATAEPLLLRLAIADHQRVEADGAVVDEHPAVELADVDRPRSPAGDLGGRFGEVGGHAEVAREMVERPEWEDAERGLAPGQRPGGRADRAVAAAGDDQRRAALDRRLRPAGDLVAFEPFGLAVDAGAVERLADRLATVVGH